MAQQNRYNYTQVRNGYTPYVDGTVAPQLEPRRQPQQPARKARPAAQPKSSTSPAMFLFLTIATVAFIATCIYLLSVQSSVTTSHNKVESLQAELQAVRADNDAKEVALNKSIDLAEIYKIATEELGMVYPSEDQVVYYQRSDGGYVRQYEEIPTN